jgi:hypothetical protein
MNATQGFRPRTAYRKTAEKPLSRAGVEPATHSLKGKRVCLPVSYKTCLHIELHHSHEKSRKHGKTLENAVFGLSEVK